MADRDDEILETYQCWYCMAPTARVDGSGHDPECPYTEFDQRGGDEPIFDDIDGFEAALFDEVGQLMDTLYGTKEPKK